MVCKRNCPRCGKIITYSRTWTFNRAETKQSSCVSCVQKERLPRTKEHCDSISKGKIGKRRKPFSTEWRNNIRKARLGQKLSESTKKKLRLLAIQRIQRQHGQIFPNYNPEACRLIEEYGRKHGYNFQHAENGGEFHIKDLGYWVDGYDEEQNTVIEYYESHHYKDGKLKERDLMREIEIKEHLGCQLVRLEE